ncbi:MAG: aspartate-semialdehyde dehydrogenase [Candidatus Aminicenantes bacterium]|nr:aspartate-semialdehyde dehydrogenase [Candidatus Aminicenantes bacterium]
MKTKKIKKLKAGVLGCTGLVGQQFIRMLDNHPFFEIGLLTASKKSAGKKYKESTNWSLGGDVPLSVEEIVIKDTMVESVCESNVEVVFSALPSAIAKKIELPLAKKGFFIFSNAGANRMRPDVPIIIPEVNPDHLELVRSRVKNGKGFIITNSNCSTSGLVMGLAPLVELGIRNVFVSTYQAISGAGRQGLASIDIHENVIPFIKEEEEKIERETRKILGWLENGSIREMSIDVFAGCCRVPVRDGHLLNVMVDLEEDIRVDVISQIMESFRSIPQALRLPTAPEKPLIIRHERNRPQPHLDKLAGTPFRAQGMSVSVGRIRKKGKRLLFTLLVNNTIRGAAGVCVLNAELALLKNILNNVNYQDR